jgi:hypothetical protein
MNFQEETERTEDEWMMKIRFLIVKLRGSRPVFPLNPLILRLLCYLKSSRFSSPWFTCGQPHKGRELEKANLTMFTWLRSAKGAAHASPVARPREHDGMGSSPERATQELDRLFRSGLLRPQLRPGYEGQEGFEGSDILTCLPILKER